MPKCQIKFWIIPLKEHIILPAKVTFHKAVDPHISCVSHIHCTFKLDICWTTHSLKFHSNPSLLNGHLIKLKFRKVTGLVNQEFILCGYIKTCWLWARYSESLHKDYLFGLKTVHHNICWLHVSLKILKIYFISLLVIVWDKMWIVSSNYSLDHNALNFGQPLFKLTSTEWSSGYLPRYKCLIDT